MGEMRSWTVVDAVDYMGNPADRAKIGGWIPAAIILGIEICERLSTMGIAVNLVTYFGVTMHLSSATSANTVKDFMGTSFMLCLLGGLLADSFLGRYRTIATFASVQTVGTCLLAVSTKLPKLRPLPCYVNNDVTKYERASDLQMRVLYIALYLIALGTGGLKSSVSGFGTDQFDEKDKKEKAQMAYFFSRNSIYRYKKCTGSPIVHIYQVVVAAVKKRKIELTSNTASLYEDYPEESIIQHTSHFRFLDNASIVTKPDYGDDGFFVYNPWLLSPVTRVEEVKMVIKLLPIWVTTILFWSTYAQMITFSVEQASIMERSIGHFQIPAGSLTGFFVSAILITLGTYHRRIIPLWKKWKGKPGFTSLQLIAIGLFLSVVGMASAAIVELKRLSVVKTYGTTKATQPVSVFYLVPQFFLVGSGEGFIYTGQLDFFITQSPEGMKTMSTGLLLTTLSFGFFFSSLLVSIVKVVTGSSGKQGWVGDNINKWRLDCFYRLLAVLSFINFWLFLLCASWYSKKTVKQVPEMEIIKEGSSAEEKHWKYRF